MSILSGRIRIFRDRLQYFYYFCRATFRYILFSLLHAKKKSVPEYLFLDMCNYCTADCVFCAYRYDRRPKEIMPYDIFEKAVLQFKKMGGKKINLTPIWGELFCVPDILTRINFLKSVGFCEIRTYSNATLFHKFAAEDILCSGLTTLNISTAPFAREIFEKIYRNADYSQVLDNIKTILKTFRDLKAVRSKNLTVKEMTIELRADRPPSSSENLPDFRREIAPFLTAGVSIKSFQIFDSWSGVIAPGDLLPGMSLKIFNGFHRLPCLRTSYLQVSMHGKVRLCGCRLDVSNDNDELCLGNFADDSLVNFYNSRRTLEVKQTFLREKLLNVCSKCAWYEL